MATRGLGEPNWLTGIMNHDPIWAAQSQQATAAQIQQIQRAQELMAKAVDVGIPIDQYQPSMAQRARELFLRRMGGVRAEMKVTSSDFLQCHVYGETVHLFYCFGGKSGVVQESVDVFPSDTLITQFRMILA